MPCEFGQVRIGQEKNRESKTIFDTTRKGNLPIAINKMTYDAFTLFIQLLQLERLSAFHH